MKQLYRRFLAMILVVAMGLTMLPMEAFAEAYSDGTQINLPLADGRVPIQIQKLDENGKPDGDPIETTVSAGDVSTTAPSVEGYDFLYAKVNNSEVSYLGSYNGQTYYSDSDNNAVLLIVPKGTTPVFYYEPHVEVYSVEYSLNGTTGAAYDGPETVRADTPLNFQVSTPRGCETIVSYTMGSVSQTLTETSKSSTPDGDTLIYEIKQVTDNVQIEISVNEIEIFSFGMDSTFATSSEGWPKYGHGATFTPAVGSFERGQSFTWTLTGGTEGGTYWIMNGLEINGEDLSIPFSQGKTTTTTLSTGTDVTITWTSTWTNSQDRKYNIYTISVSNAYEDIYITGGNFRASGHKEVMPTLISPGVNAQWRSQDSNWQWKDAISSTPIGFGSGNYVDIRYKLEPGYENLKATVDGETKYTRPDDNGWHTITIYSRQVNSNRGFADVQITCDLAEYTVSYTGGTQSAAGNLPVDSQRYDVVNNNTIYIPSNIPTANNVVFQGWDVDGNGEVDYRPAAQVSLTDVLESADDSNRITFKAIWKSVEESKYVTYTINLYLEGQDEPAETYTGQGIDGTQLLVRSQDGSWIAQQLAKYPDYELPERFTDTITLGRNGDNTVGITLVRKTYTVTYNANGGTDAMDPDTVKSGEDYTVKGNEFTRTGYKFTGWNTAADGTGTDYSENATIATVRKNITLYAQWEQTIYQGDPITVEVIMDDEPVAAQGFVNPTNLGNTADFNATYGNDVYTITYTYDNLNCADIKLDVTVPEGYSVSVDSDDRSDTEGLDGTIVPCSITGSGANWSLDNVPGGATVTVTLVPNSHTVSYKYTDQSGNEHVFKEPVNRYFGTTVQVSTDVPQAPAGYHFSGWTTDDAEVTNDSFTMPDNDVVFVGSFIANDNTHYQVQWYYQNADGSYPTTTSVTENRYGTTGTEATVTDADKAETQNGLYVYNSDKSTEKSTITGDGSTVLKLYFDRAEFDVKYEYSNEVDGAPSPPEEQDYKWGTTGIQVETAPTLEGYVFSGWTTTDAKVENGSFTMPQQDVTFTGSWTKLYTVTYNPNGGVGNPHIVDVKDGEDHTVLDNTETDFTKTNYHFVGWNAQADGSGKSYLKDEVISGISSNITLYAQWEIDKVAYTIEYYLDGNPVESPYAGAPTGDSADIDTEVDVRTMQGYRTSFGETGSHYVLDEGAENVFEITINADTTQNVLKVYYASDNKGGEEDPDTPDEIPDKDQVIFRYVADSNGSITGKTHETITKTDDVTTAQPTGTTVQAADGYKFQKWTRSTDNTEDNDKEMTTFKGISYSWGSDVTFTVHFTKLDNLSYTIHHYLLGTEVKVAGDTTGTGTFQDKVTVEAATNFLAGYEKAKFASKTADTITITTGTNEATVYYKMPLTITAGNARRDYNGQPLTCGTFTVDGLVNGDTNDGISLSMTAESTITNAGRVDNVIDVSTVNGVKDYYEVTYVNGTLTIDPINNLVVTISGNQKQEVYNGQTQTVSGYTAKFTVDGQEVTGYGLEDFTYSGESTTASGNDVETYTVNLDQTKFTWNDTTNFTNVTFKVERDIELTITPKTITVTAIDLTMNYGETVPAPEINEEALEAQLATGDEIAVIQYTLYIDFKEANENKPPVGTYDIKFQEENGVKGNYNVTYVPATLTVNAPSGFAYVEKSHENGTFDSAGDEVTFNITVHNIYDVPATVELREQPGVTFIAAESATLEENGTVLKDTLDPNTSKTYQATYTVTQEDLRNTKITNIVNLKLTVGEDTINDTATDTVIGLQAKAILAVEKTVQNLQASYGPGETITYNIKVTNTGNQTLTDVTLTDTLKADEAVVGDPTITGYDGPFDLTPGDFKNFTVTYEVKESDLGKTLVNTATATGKDPEGNPVTATDSTDGETTHGPSRLLEVTKVVLTDNGYAPSGKDENGNPVYALGDTIHYRITVTNTGNVTLQNVTLEDVLTLTSPDGTSKDVEIPVEDGATFTLNRSGLEGSSKTFHVYYPVKESDLGKTLSNVATATSGETEDENEPAVVQTEDLKPSLSVTKEADRTSAKVGDTINYTIKVTNTGNQTLNNIEVTDDLTNETWEIEILAPGKTSEELTTTYTVQVSDLVKGKVTNIATATVENGPTASGTAKVDVTGKLDISVNLASGKFTYNGEPHTVSGAATVKYGESPINVSDGKFTIGDTKFTLNFDEGKGTATETDVRWKIDGTVDSYPVTATPADIKVTVDGSTTECLNITAVNSGTLTIEPATLTVTTESAEGEYPVGTALTADGNYTGLQNGETLTFEVTGKQEFVGSSKNTYTITWDGTAKKGNYTIVENLGTLTVTAPANYDYVQKTHVSTGDDGNKLTFDVGDTITFQITVHNIYDKPATVTLTEKLENVTFKENVEDVTLTAGETKTFDATYMVTQADVIKGEINNTVKWTLTPENDQPITGEDKDEVTDLVYEPSLSVTKTVTSPAGTNDKYALGDTIEYQIVVKNDGNVTINGIVVSDVMHEKLADETTEKIDEGTVHYAGDGTFSGTLEPEQSATFTFEYTVQEADLGKTLVNIATATGEDPRDSEKDITGTGNTPGEKTDSPNPKLDVKKTVENAHEDGTPFKLGEEIQYKIVVTNTGNVTLTGIKVTDEMTHEDGDGTPLTGGELLDASGEPSNGFIEKLVPEGQEGEPSATFYYTYTVKESDLGKTLVNVATATSDETEGENTPVKVTPDTRNPELKVVKTASTPKDGTDFALDETIDYTITLTNTGNVTLNVSIRDMFGTRDDGSTIQEDITSKLTCQSENFNGTLEPDASVTYTYSYTVTEADLGKDIVNTVSFTAVDEEEVPAGQDEDSVTEVISQTDEPNPDLKVKKTVLNTNEAPFDYNETIHYQITVSNKGNVTLTGVNVVDELLADGVKIHDLDVKGGDNITLAPKGHEGDSVTLYVDYTVKEEDLGKTLVNTVTVESDQTKPDPEDPNNDDHDETDGEKTEDPTPNMEVSKTVVGDKGSYRVGDVITYQITVKNTGNTTIHNIKLTDVMQASGDVKFTSLDSGKLENGVPVRDSLEPKTNWVVTCQYTVQLADANSDGTTISNKVTVNADGGPDGKDPEAQTPGENIDPIYTLTIRYQSTSGRKLAEPFVGQFHEDAGFSVATPPVAGYHLTQNWMNTITGFMPGEDLTIVVVYARNPEEDDDEPPVVPDEETTEETKDEVDPGVYIEDPDDYTLTPITEEEPPLADLYVGDHTCCIMHFLLMLAAMVVLGFYTDSKKKHQARIFELKRTLAMEKGKNPDGDNSQQS